MSGLIGALLAGLAIGVVLYPFLKWWTRARRTRGLRPNVEGLSWPNAGAPRSSWSREATCEAINTLQLEYELGSVEETEYVERLRSYRLQLASHLRDQERREGELGRSLEEDVLSHRAHLTHQLGPPVCPRCGEPASEEGGLCGACGAELTAESPPRTVVDDGEESGG